MASVDLGVPSIGSFPESQRQLNICNSCRYCAAYCPVWPALEQRVDLTPADVTHLANLCHDCRDCYVACMYIPPHEFAVNPPEVFAKVRSETYDKFIWPTRRPGWLRNRTGLTLALVLVTALLVGLSLFTTDGEAFQHGPGSAYDLISHWVLIGVCLAPFVFSIVVIAAGAAGYWRFTHGPLKDLFDVRAWITSLGQAAVLRHQAGAAEACTSGADEKPSPARRIHHQLVVYGFLLTLLATTSAAFYQYILGLHPPYPYLSVPVVSGTVGGIMQVVGCIGLMYYKRRSDPGQTTRRMWRADFAFIWALLIINVTGLLVLVVRTTPWFGPTLIVHLAAVLLAFAIAPYTKFVHFVFRLLAIYKNTLEVSAAAPRH